MFLLMRALLCQGTHKKNLKKIMVTPTNQGSQISYIVNSDALFSTNLQHSILRKRIKQKGPYSPLLQLT